MDEMARKQAPTARLRRLAAELKRHRGVASLTREVVEQRTGINPATLYRIESARSRPQKRTLVSLLDLYGVTDPIERDKLVELTRDSNRLGWLQFYEPELPEGYQTYISFEAEADELWNYEGSYVPGLLQTEAYARAVIRGVLPAEDDEGVERRVEVRVRRQTALTKDRPVKLRVVIDEAVIRRQVGGRGVMTEQLRHLTEVAASPRVTLQLVPYSAGAHPGMPGAFLVMQFPNDDPALVYTENAGGGLFLEAEGDVERYRSTFRQLSGQALSARDTSRFINDAATAG